MFASVSPQQQQQKNNNNNISTDPLSLASSASSIITANNSLYDDNGPKPLINNHNTGLSSGVYHHKHHGSIGSNGSSNTSQRHMHRQSQHYANQCHHSHPHHHPHPHHHHHHHHYHSSHHPSLHSLHSQQERRRSSVRNNGIPTLETVLENKAVSPYSLFEFENFMKRSHCFENYMFITEVDNLLTVLEEKHCCNNYKYDEDECEEEREEVANKNKYNNDDDNDGKESFIKDLWNHILLVYITVYADFEINLSCDIRDRLLGYRDHESENDDIKSQDVPIPEIAAFVDAKDETFVLLQDAFLQFLKSVANKENNNVFIDKFGIYSKLQNFNLKHLDNNRTSTTDATTISRSSNHSNSTESNSIVSNAQQALFNKNYCFTTITTSTNNNPNSSMNVIISPLYGGKVSSPSFSSFKTPIGNSQQSQQQNSTTAHSPLARTSTSVSPVARKSPSDSLNLINVGSNNIDNTNQDTAIDDINIYDSDSNDGLHIYGMNEFVNNNNHITASSSIIEHDCAKLTSKSKKSSNDNNSKNLNNGKNGIKLTQLKKMGKKFRLF